MLNNWQRRKRISPYPLRYIYIYQERFKNSKADSEDRAFKEQRSLDNFVMECSVKGLCLICNETTALLKESNDRRQWKKNTKNIQGC